MRAKSSVCWWAKGEEEHEGEKGRKKRRAGVNRVHTNAGIYVPHNKKAWGTRRNMMQSQAPRFAASLPYKGLLVHGRRAVAPILPHRPPSINL
jgi:hypothetical protein